MIFLTIQTLSLVLFLSRPAQTLDNRTPPLGVETFLGGCAIGNEALVSGLLTPENLRSRDSANRTGLMLAAENGHCQLVKMLMQQKSTDENARSNDGSTALIFAVKNGHFECFKHITLYGQVDVNAQRNDGWSALHLAARDNNVEAVRHLVNQKGIDINGKSDRGMTPLMIAAEANSTQAAILLVESGADVNVPSKSEGGRGALHFAAAKGSLELVRRLIQQGANVNAGTVETPLISACKENQTDSALFLINRGANLDAIEAGTNRSALFISVQQGNSAVAQTLVFRGANVELAGPDNMNALMEAAKLARCRDMVPLLAPRTKDLERKSFYHGATAFLWAVNIDGEECLRTLAANKVNIDAQQGRDSMSAVHIAGFNVIDQPKLLEIAKLLVELGCNVNLKEWNNRTPLQCSIYLKDQIFAEYLASLPQTNVSVMDSDYTLLALAAWKNFAHLCSTLVKNRGLDIESRNEKDMTPLIIAAFYNATEAAVVLVENGANVNAASSKLDGRTALHYAAEANKQYLVRRLIDERADMELGRRETPLICAVNAKAIDSALVLLDRGANVNARQKDTGNTPLHFAVLRNLLQVADRLIYRGAEINAKNAKGETPLKLAKDNNLTDLVEFLKSKGAAD